MTYPMTYINPFNNLYQGLLSRAISMNDFIKELKEQGYIPCRPTWFKRRSWSLEQAVLIFHNFEPSKFENIPWEVLQDFIKLIDEKHDIYGILNNRIPSFDFPNPEHLNQKKILELFHKLNIEIPQHFRNNSSSSSTNHLPSDSSTCEHLLETVLGNGRPRRESFRKSIIALAAEMHRMAYKANGKKEPSAASLARNKNMKNLVDIVNKLGELKAHTEDIDPEWINLIPNIRETQTNKTST